MHHSSPLQVSLLYISLAHNKLHRVSASFASETPEIVARENILETSSVAPTIPGDVVNDMQGGGGKHVKGNEPLAPPLILACFFTLVWPAGRPRLAALARLLTGTGTGACRARAGKREALKAGPTGLGGAN